MLSNLLVVNAGSSSLKLRVLDQSDRVLESADLPAGDEGWQTLAELMETWPRFAVSVHRVVHGGSRFLSGVVIDDDVVEELESLIPLAPLHNPPAVAGIRTLLRLRPDLPAVACFDTTFHSTLPPEAAVYGIPWRWTEEHGVRRFGFHGLSHSYVSRRAATLLGHEPEDLRVVVCHLGAGASLAAVAFGRSVDTTMGFTPLEGLIMATRSGSVDPGALLWLQEKLEMSAEAMTDQLSEQSGLLGMSGVSGDIRRVIDAAGRREPRATLALAAYCARVGTGIGAMAASMGGIDALAFTGGVGERSAPVRQMACRRLGFLGIELDPKRNDSAGDRDVEISAPGGQVKVFRIGTREDLEMAAEVRRLLAE